MGLEGPDLVDDGDGGSKAAAAASVSCSICLEVVADNGDRSMAKLQCGHQFHLETCFICILIYVCFCKFVFASDDKRGFWISCGISRTMYLR
ncbi:putative transcription factor C2H2 family [Helianthus annuus]|nr:putative transcription factor C2H2 family [Helianthus annuus]